MAKFGSGAERTYQHIDPGVSDLETNRTLIVAEVNEDSAGEDIKNRVRCDSLVDVAKKFKPTKTFNIKKVDNVASDDEPEEVSITMDYSRNTTRVVDNFLDKNIIGKARDNDDNQVLLEQRLQILILNDLAERLRDTKFQKTLQEKKAELIATLKDELDQLS